MKSLVATLLVAALAATGKATSADELYSGLWLRPPVQVMRGYPGLCYSLCYNEIKQSDPNCSCQADFIIERIICAGIGSTTDEGYVYAVKRIPGELLTCKDICENKLLKTQDPTLVKWNCQ